MRCAEVLLYILAQAQIRKRPVHLSYLPRFDRLPYLDAQWEVPCPHGLHEEKLLFPRNLHQLLRLRRVHGERLLA